MSLEVSINWDRAGMRRTDKFLGGYQGRELEKRIAAGMVKELRPLVAKLRAAESASGIHNRTGEHLKKIRLKNSRRYKKPGELVALTAGPTDRKRHLLIRGHRLVTPGGRDTGRRSRAFDYVGPVITAEAPEIMQRLGSDVWAARVGGNTSFAGL